ncbi:hypothetical protein RZN25_03945 [Bacillaceae bacterium S4-13-56]
MISFRGDAHKIYLKMREASNKGVSYKNLKMIKEMQEIQDFYQSIETDTLKKLYYRMMKERNGSGIVLIFVTAVPWFLFLFSGPLEEFLMNNGSFLWLTFTIIYFSILTIMVTIHFRENAWATVHVEIIRDILNERNE